MASQKSSIDLEVTFDFNSAIPGAVPTLVMLGRALGNQELKGLPSSWPGTRTRLETTATNQSLSERRTEAVKIFLPEQFKLSPDQLPAIGFDRSELKNTADPLAAENRRVQIVNIEQQATVSQK
jgi:hypothetical protein